LALREMLCRGGHGNDEADVRARTIYLTQIGYISMRAQEDVETRLIRIPVYVEIYTGRIAEQREIARFNARVRSSANQLHQEQPVTDTGRMRSVQPSG